MRLRRSVVLGLVVRDGVVAALVGAGVPDRLGLLPRGLLLVRLGRRQREHRARRGLLRRRPLGGGGQRTPAPPRRLLLPRSLGGNVHGDPGLGRVGRPVPAGRRGQRRRQRLLLTHGKYAPSLDGVSPKHIYTS
ncbi:hypothetical protein ACWC8S_35790, partial [Streptomyces fungicidicus]